MKLVLGARGRLGTGLCAELAADGLLAPDRSVYQDWWRPTAVSEITRYLDVQGPRVDAVFVATGVIDPNATAVAHERVNYLLPQQVIRAAAPLGIRVITFGTIMEAISSSIPSAGYVASKVALAEFVERQQTQARGHALHLRIHTLYGGGHQILSCLRGRCSRHFASASTF